MVDSHVIQLGEAFADNSCFSSSSEAASFESFDTITLSAGVSVCWRIVSCCLLAYLCATSMQHTMFWLQAQAVCRVHSVAET